MTNFGWSYPPGCSGPPEDFEPDEWSSEVIDILTEAEVDQEVIDRVAKIVIDLAILATADCPRCEKAAFEAEMEAERKAEEYWRTRDLEDEDETTEEAI